MSNDQPHSGSRWEPTPAAPPADETTRQADADSAPHAATPDQGDGPADPTTTPHDQTASPPDPSTPTEAASGV